MPVIYQYHPRRSSVDSDSDSEHPEPTNADDSIVLSDLVRTGEASRLRRRGAMRLEGGLSGSSGTTLHLPNAIRPPPSPPAILIRNNWDSSQGPRTPEEGFTDGGGRFNPYGRPRMNAELRRSDSIGQGYTYTLFCGGEEVDSGTDNWSSAPFEPSILPIDPTTPSSTPLLKSNRRSRRSNGCGALVHLQASPRRRLGVWIAETAATNVVVELDTSYFDRTAVVKIVKSGCGCIREGVGCAVCGNPLGTRYKPCEIAAQGLFSSRRQSLPPPCLESPRYWQAISSSPSSSQDFYVYTFFSTAVSSSPHLSFPTPHTSPSEVDNDQYNMFDRVFTASPATLSDTIEEDEDDQTADGDNGPIERSRLDADGMLIEAAGNITAPNSPDKIGSEIMLFPER